jgi:DNA helicase II / ATP-dependent DNA helicase PcrA
VALFLVVQEHFTSRGSAVSGVVVLKPNKKLDDEFADFEVREELEKELERRLTESDLDGRSPLRNFEPIADDDQRAVINSRSQTVRIVAPAGAGKTQTLINRILSLVSAGARPERILCLTFDNSAANALKEKVNSQTETGLSPEQFQITTLNAFGFRILRENFPQEYRQIIEPGRVWRLVNEVKKELAAKPGGRERVDALPENLKLRFYGEFFSLLKNSMLDPRDVAPQAFADFMLTGRSAEAFFAPGTTTEQKKLIIQAVHWMFVQYDKVLQRERRIDFDDQKLRSVKCLMAHPSTLNLIQRRYDEIIVDEFQDINKLDFEFVQRLAGNSRLTVTGDDDQAIYGFRGCTPQYIIDLQKMLGRPVQSLELRKNYRCPKNIVEHAVRLIEHNTLRIPKSPIAVRDDVASIKVADATTASAEAKLIATTIEKVKRKNPALSFSDFAVLYRTNAQSLPIQLQFILRDIPYQVRDQDNILLNDELAKLLGALRLKRAIQEGKRINPSDSVLTVKAYFRWFDERITRRLEDHFSSDKLFSDLISSDRFYSIMPKAKDSRFKDAIIELVSAPSLFKSLDVLAKFKGLRGMIGDLEQVADGDVPLGEVYELAASFRGSIQSFVDTVGGALDKAREGNAGHSESGVMLATYFKAKGLQWHTVILTSCVEGLIPHKRAPVEEERRLFYVALTRASSNLIVSYLGKSCRQKVAPSRFLSEAGLL